MANHVPFDERPNPKVKIEDISMVLLRDYLVKIGSRLQKSLFTQPLELTLEQMDLYTGPSENRMLKNVAAIIQRSSSHIPSQKSSSSLRAG